MWLKDFLPTVVALCCIALNFQLDSPSLSSGVFLVQNHGVDDDR